MIKHNSPLFHQAEWSEWLPAASSQRSLSAIDFITRGDARPMVHTGLLIEGAWDRAKLEAAIATAFERHDGMRVRFASIDDQIMVNTFPWSLSIEECALDGETDEDRLRNAGPYFAPRLDLDAGQGIQWGVIHDSADRHLVIMIAHHALLDGLSKLIAMQDIAEAYANGVSSLAPVEAEALQSILKDIALGRRAAEIDAAEGFWREYLSPLPGSLGGHTIAPANEGPSFQREIIMTPLDGDAIGRLFARAAAQSTRPFVVMTSFFAECFAADAAKLVTVATSGRDRPSRRRSVGCFMQTMPMRVHWQGPETFSLLDAELKILLKNTPLPTDELMARGILPARGMFAAPIDMQFQVRREDPTLIVDRSGLRLSIINPICGVRNLQPISTLFQLGPDPYLCQEFDNGLVDPVAIEAMGTKVQSMLADQ